MTEETTKPRSTLQTWIVLIGFAVLGIFAVVMFNLASSVQENRQQKTQAFFDSLQKDDVDRAFEMLSSTWQTRIESADALRTSFEGITVNDVKFGLDLGDCYTATELVGGERRPTNDSVRYSYSDGTAQVNGEPAEVHVRFVSESGDLKILGMFVGDINYGPEIPDDCIFG